ncbi:MAG: ATP-binding protein [Deltaproteobacteria bacterium]|nr:ATP-binding protein [Deltaproteobacteria bacterium]
MYDRIFDPPEKESYFLFGPRGTGKTSFLKTHYPKSPYFDLLDAHVIQDLRVSPSHLEERLAPNYQGPIIIDEVQKLPELLDEVHRLIEETSHNLQFILTGSSARKLKAHGVNLLAGRALVYNFFPLTVEELGGDFNLEKALKYGMLPKAWTSQNPKKFLQSYVQTYIDQEVKMEGLTRNILDFSRFLQAASFSQGSPLSISNTSEDCAIERRTVTNYFEILEDLLIAYRLPVFSKRSKRNLIKHSKFYFFDSGVYQTIRPRGPLDSDSENYGISLETLILQQLKAINDLKSLGFELFYWRTRNGIEVDFVLYGQRGLFCFEVKSASHARDRDFEGLIEFKKDYPMATAGFIYGGKRHYTHRGIEVIPVDTFLANLHKRFL